MILLQTKINHFWMEYFQLVKVLQQVYYTMRVQQKTQNIAQFKPDCCIKPSDHAQVQTFLSVCITLTGVQECHFLSHC